jgi:PAS domain S-box-containing protein
MFMSSFFLVLMRMNRAQKLREFEHNTARMGELIAIGLQNGMLERNLGTVQEMVAGLAEHEGVEDIYIINKDGDVKISSDNSSIDVRFDLESDTCQICHKVSPESRGRSVIFNTDGQRMFRSVTPIQNQLRCHACHPSSEKLNGVLIADFSMAPFDREMRAGFLGMLAAIGVTVLGLAGVIWILMDRLVLHRLERFIESVRSIASGDLSRQITVEGDDEISELELAFNNMSENLRTSMADVKFAHDSLTNLINSIEDEIILIDRDFRVVSANDAALSRLGVKEDEIVERLCHDACYGSPEPCGVPERDCPVKETFRKGASTTTDRTFVADGEARHFEQYVSPVRNEKGEIIEVVKISRDVTRRRKLEDQLVQSERLISLGQLAAGVAHQINNPIGIIVNRIDCLKREGQTGALIDSLQSDLDVISHCAWRVDEITRSLLTFSRESPMMIVSLDVNEALTTSLELVRMQAHEKNVDFEARLQPALPTMRGDINKLEQCFVNILNNAVDAVPEEGRVTVESYADSKKGGPIRIIISDTGSGIDPEDLKKIFNPFFTTKEVGKGTGLGLSISYGIVKDHGGQLEASSVLGEGTTFTITLPAETMSEIEDEPTKNQSALR